MHTCIVDVEHLVIYRLTFPFTHILNANLPLDFLQNYESVSPNKTYTCIHLLLC